MFGERGNNRERGVFGGEGKKERGSEGKGGRKGKKGVK